MDSEGDKKVQTLTDSEIDFLYPGGKLAQHLTLAAHLSDVMPGGDLQHFKLDPVESANLENLATRDHRESQEAWDKREKVVHENNIRKAIGTDKPGMGQGNDNGDGRCSSEGCLSTAAKAVVSKANKDKVAAAKAAAAAKAVEPGEGHFTLDEVRSERAS